MLSPQKQHFNTTSGRFEINVLRNWSKCSPMMLFQLGLICSLHCVYRHHSHSTPYLNILTFSSNGVDRWRCCGCSLQTLVLLFNNEMWFGTRSYLLSAFEISPIRPQKYCEAISGVCNMNPMIREALFLMT